MIQTYKGSMMIKRTLLLSLVAMSLLAVPSLQAQQSGQGQGKAQKQNKMGKKQGKVSPFLISKGLPHMTMMIKQNWENPKLGLSQDQKKKLLVVRKATVGGIQALKPQVVPLEKKIKQMSRSGADISKLNPLIDELAVLKAKMTKVHVKCIFDSKNILTKAQVQFLLQR